MARQPWKWLLIFLLVRLSGCAPIDADAESGGSPPEVTPEEFSALKGTYFIKFYSPLCPHCRELAPKWDGAYQDMGGPDSKGFKWASVNCLSFSDFCSDNAITAYPALRIYRDGKRIHDYSSSGPTRADLSSFAKSYISIGDKAFNAEYELAPKDVSNYEMANRESEKAAKEAQQNENIQAEKNSQASADEKSQSAEYTPFEGTNAVTKLHAGDFGLDKNVGRWFVLFTGVNCESCESLAQKWEKHDNFARSVDGINWGRVDCAEEEALCDLQGVFNVPSLRIYQDGVLAYVYQGDLDTMALRNFVLYAATANSFENFSLSDLESPSSSNPDSQLEGAGPNQEPNYLSGPAVQRPNYGNERPKIVDVVKYTLDTLGQPIDEDPGKLIFGDSPEAHHNFRTWGAPDSPPPPFLEEFSGATHSNGKVLELNDDEFASLVKTSTEPWIVKFYSPKCPHCQSMAAAYEDMALQAKGQLNVAAVNCEVNGKTCKAENVTGYPFITLYRGPIALEPFEGSRTAEAMLNYAKKAWQAQIFPVENEEQLALEIVANLDKNITTFLYLYDQSVMAEDWESLTRVAANINKWGGKLYRSNNEQLRELAGIKHRGTAFINVDFIGTPGEGTLKWHDFPWSNIPKKIRDVDEVSNWAYRAKYSLMQYLEPKAQTRFSPYVAVILTEDNQPPSRDANITEHHRKALELRDFYIQRQIDDQDKLRIDRLRQHDKALVENRFREARHLMRQPIETPVRVDLAFAYIPLSRWVRDYSKYVDVSKHALGNVIVLDFYNGIYLDEFNLVPINDDRDVLDDVVELLRRYQIKDPKTTFKSIRHFKSSMSGVPQPEHRPLHFESKPYRKNKSLFSSIPLMLKLVLATVALYFVYIKIVRPRIRAFSNRDRARRIRELKNDF